MDRVEFPKCGLFGFFQARARTILHSYADSGERALITTMCWNKMVSWLLIGGKEKLMIPDHYPWLHP
jgi:hypothetical protein